MKSFTLAAALVVPLLLYCSGCSEIIDKPFSNDPVVIQRKIATARADAEWHRLITESCRTSQEGQVIEQQTKVTAEKAKLAEERTRLLAAERALREELARNPQNSETQ